MEYDCVKIDINRLPTNRNGILNSLCSNCCSPDCSNRIEEVVVSLIGINKKEKVFVKNEKDYYYIIDCNGYIKNEQV